MGDEIPSMLPALPAEAQTAADQRRHAENKGRLAMCGERFKSTGLGVVEFENKVDFGMTFIRRPFMSYGSEIDWDALREQLDLDEDDLLPAIQCTGYVTDWDTTTKGMYVGAFVCVAVYFPLATSTPDQADRSTQASTGVDASIAVPADLAVEIEHHFSFQEIALKDITSGGLQAPAYSAPVDTPD